MPWLFQRMVNAICWTYYYPVESVFGVVNIIVDDFLKIDNEHYQYLQYTCNIFLLATMSNSMGALQIILLQCIIISI